VNGVVGFKPTHGIVSGDGIVPLALTQDTAGPIAADVTLAARTLAVMIDPAAQNAGQLRRGLLALDAVGSLDGLRIGVFANTLGFDARRDRNLQRVLDILEDAGVELVPDLRIKPYDGYQRDSYEVLLWEFQRDLNAYLAGLATPVAVRSLDELVAFNRRYDDDALRRFDQSIFRDAQALGLSEAEYGRKRLATRRAMRDEGLDALFEAHRLDALIGVTTGVAWKIDWINGDSFFGPGMAGQAAVAGNPHITLPLARIEALPHGISLVGERHQDHRLAAIAKLVEDAVPH
jgi:Asp-tRNA(Asn)/Glu-tRNA(Gln) amidotransferase A subunit family amidase